MRRFFRRFNLVVLPRLKPKPYTQEYIKKATPAERSKTPKARTTSKKKKDWSADKSKWVEPWSKESLKGFYSRKRAEVSARHLQEWKRNKLRGNFSEFLKEIRREKFGLGPKREFRGGNRASFRQYKNYGPMKPLGPKLIFELVPTGIYTQQFMRLQRGKKADIVRIKRQTKEAMEKLLKGLIDYGETVIGKYVPKDTGYLRDEMIRSLKRSKVRGMSLKVSLDTGLVPYANVVNNMPTRMLAHPHPGGRPDLFDPKAVKGWWQFIDMQLNTYGRKLFKVFVQDLESIWTYEIMGKNAPSPWKGMSRGQAMSARERVQIPPHRKYHEVGRQWVPYQTPEQIRKGKPISEARQVQRPYFKKEKYPAYQTAERRPKTIEDPWEEDRQRYKRAMDFRHNIETRKRHASVVYLEKNVLGGMFKLKGINRR